MVSNVVIMMAKEDVEVYLHVLQTMTEHIQLCGQGLVVLKDCIIVREVTSGLWDAPYYATCLFTSLQQFIKES
jgi:hypothetical protein